MGINKKVIDYEQWKKEGESLFGKDMKKWKFICPCCKNSQTYQDFIDAGCNPETAGSMTGFSCVGRVKEENPQSCLGAKKSKGLCDYAGGGLINLSPITVNFPRGTINIFDFDRELNS